MLNFVGKERKSTRKPARLETFGRHLCPREITNVTLARARPFSPLLFSSLPFISLVLSACVSLSQTHAHRRAKSRNFQTLETHRATFRFSLRLPRGLRFAIFMSRLENRPLPLAQPPLPYPRLEIE